MDKYSIHLGWIYNTATRAVKDPPVFHMCSVAVGVTGYRPCLGDLVQLGLARVEKTFTKQGDLEEISWTYTGPVPIRVLVSGEKVRTLVAGETI